MSDVRGQSRRGCKGGKQLGVSSWLVGHLVDHANGVERVLREPRTVRDVLGDVDHVIRLLRLWVYLQEQPRQPGQNFVYRFRSGQLSHVVVLGLQSPFQYLQTVQRAILEVLLARKLLVRVEVAATFVEDVQYNVKQLGFRVQLRHYVVARGGVNYRDFAALELHLASDEVFDSRLVLFDELREYFQTGLGDFPLFARILVRPRVKLQEDGVDDEMQVRIETRITLAHP